MYFPNNELEFILTEVDFATRSETTFNLAVKKMCIF